VEHGHDPGLGEDGSERRQVVEGEGVHEPDLSRGNGQLDKGEPLRIVVEAVPFGVEGDFARGGEPLRDVAELVACLNPARRDRG
jgi:hypothetical protein